mmetsp:Transcript_10620/g.19469  ORF Transcript_10620/g.19469 Transcript_10620/m.19469 type:complete len:211 (+) Transcript_10620:423-1055(+)
MGTGTTRTNRKTTTATTSTTTTTTATATTICRPRRYRHCSPDYSQYFDMVLRSTHHDYDYFAHRHLLFVAAKVLSIVPRTARTSSMGILTTTTTTTTVNLSSRQRIDGRTGTGTVPTGTRVVAILVGSLRRDLPRGGRQRSSVLGNGRLHFGTVRNFQGPQDAQNGSGRHCRIQRAFGRTHGGHQSGGWVQLHGHFHYHFDQRSATPKVL